MGMSPWIDARFMGPIEPMIASVEAQTHRRFVKSHLAADGLRFFPEAKYFVVGRDTPRRLHVAVEPLLAYTDFAYSLFNDADRPGPEFPRCPATPRDLWPRWIAEGWFDWEPDGWPFWSHHHHLTTWWDAVTCRTSCSCTTAICSPTPRRRCAASRRSASIDVPEERWPAIVRGGRHRLDARGGERRDGDAVVDGLRGRRRRFFFKGTTAAGATCSPTTTSRSTTPRRRRSTRPADLARRRPPRVDPHDVTVTVIEPMPPRAGFALPWDDPDAPDPVDTLTTAACRARRHVRVALGPSHVFVHLRRAGATQLLRAGRTRREQRHRRLPHARAQASGVAVRRTKNVRA